MTSSKPILIQCPTCQRDVLWSEDFPFRPFCSKRCQLVDFGEWANENHRIADNPESSTEDQWSEDDSY